MKTEAIGNTTTPLLPPGWDPSPIKQRHILSPLFTNQSPGFAPCCPLTEPNPWLISAQIMNQIIDLGKEKDLGDYIHVDHCYFFNLKSNNWLSQIARRKNVQVEFWGRAKYFLFWPTVTRSMNRYFFFVCCKRHRDHTTHWLWKLAYAAFSLLLVPC